MGCDMASPAKLKANEKYIKEKTDEIKVRVPKGDKAKIQAQAESLGKSTNAYIVDLINEDMIKEP